MSDRKHIKQNLNRLSRVRTWQLLVLLVLVGFVAATFLRMNNIGMTQRRSAVLVADEQGDDIQTSNRLKDLQQYSSRHMNASTGVFYLTGAYNREVQKRTEEASQNANLKDNVLAKANEACKSRFSNWSQAYVQCVADEQAKYPPAEVGSGQPVMPSKSLYHQEFVAPAWTPDFAGFSLLGCALIIITIITRAITVVVLRSMLKRHYRDI